MPRVLTTPAVLGLSLALWACGQEPAPSETTAAGPAANTDPAAAADSTPAPWWEASNACAGGQLDTSEPGRKACRAADGTLHGRYAELHDSGKVRLEGAHAGGKRDGTWSQFSAAGELLGTFELEAGTGRYVEYRDDKSIAVQGPLRDGRREGDWRWTWSAGDDGAVKYDYIVTYRNNTPVRSALLAGDAEVKDKDAIAAVKLPDGAPAAVIGILGALAQQDGAFASLTGTAEFSSGLENTDVYGGLIGNEIGEMSGGWGYGISGNKGEATGWGTIGTGRYGTISGGGGSGYGRPGYRRRGAVIPQVRIGTPTVKGDLDKNIIRRYVRRKLPRVRHCYERELLVKPKLAGTVVVTFAITATGSVINAKAKGVDPKVSSCVGATFASIQFPKPKGGGMVLVRYPLTLRVSK